MLEVQVFWLVVLGFNTTLTAKVISWRSVMHIVFPSFLTPLLTQLFFQKPPSTFLTSFCKRGWRKYARKKSCLNWGSNTQPPGHESNMLTTEPPGQGISHLKTLWEKEKLLVTSYFFFLTVFSTYAHVLPFHQI